MDISKIKVSGTLYDIKDATARGSLSTIDGIVQNLAAVATSGSYADLSDKPTIGSGVLTIQKNGTTVDTFNANATQDKSINITVPTAVSQLTNDSGYLTSQDLTTVMTYKGAKAAVADLPSTGNKNGDVWHVNANNAEYAWNGSTWEELGTPIDLSNYIANNTYYQTITLRSTTTTLNSEDIILQTGANKIELNPTGLTYNNTKHFLFDADVITTDIEGGVDAHWSTLSDSKLLSAAVIKAKFDELPAVNNAALTMQKNGTTVKTFTANASSGVNLNITMQYGGTTGTDAETLILNVA